MPALIHRSGARGSARDVLERCLDLQSALDSLRRRIQRLQEVEKEAARLRPENAPDCAEQARTLRCRLLARCVALEQARYEAEALVDSLPAPMRQVLRARYMDGMSWAEVAEATHYSVDHCFTLHRTALRRLDGR